MVRSAAGKKASVLDRPCRSRPFTSAMPVSSQPPIRFSGVSYRVGETNLVSDLSFVVGEAETLALLGRSGSGKTTALRLVNRLLTPSEGEVVIAGKPASEWDAVRLRRRIGYVMQDVGLFPHFTVERNIALVPSLEGWAPDRIAHRVSELLEKLGLPAGLARRYPDQLSGGQRQRVGVARALAADPPILLMDEPFGALDPITRGELQREFLRLQETLGKAIVFVTHDLREALLLGDRIGLMDEGRLIWAGAPEEFRATSDPKIVAFRESLG